MSLNCWNGLTFFCQENSYVVSIMDKISLKQSVIFIGLMNVGLFVLYANTIKQLFDFWLVSYGYSHGIILFPIALGIYFYELYKSPKLDVSCINIVSVLCLSGLVLGWFLADLLNIQFVEFLAFFLMLILLNLVLTTDKLKNTYHLWPLLLILFTLPIWDFLSEILRTLETPVVVFFLNLSFIDTIQDGFLIYIPAGTFLVEQACSGFNQFIVSIPLAALYIYSRQLKFSTSYKFILLLLFLAMVFNILRIYIIVVAGQVTHMKTSLLHDHEYLGWVIYGIGVFILFFVADKRHKELSLSTVKMVSVENDNIIWSQKSVRKPLVFVALVLFMGPLLTISYSVLKNKNTINVEKFVGSLFWKEVDSEIKFSPNYAKGDISYQHTLENLFGQTITLYINHFVEQEQGREAINDVSGLVANKQGTVIKQRQQIVKLSQSSNLNINESIIRLKSGEKYIAWQWYFTNSKHLNKGLDAHLNNFVGILKNKPAITNIVVSKQIQAQETTARKALELFILDNLDVLTNNLSVSDG